MSEPSKHAIKAASELQDGLCSGQWGRAAAAERVQKAIDDAIQEPVPELRGTIPVILYFRTQAEADEFLEAARQEKPNLVTRQL